MANTSPAGRPHLFETWFVVGWALAFPTLITWLYFVALRSAPASLQQAAYTLGKVAQFGLPVLWVWWRRPSHRLEWSEAAVHFSRRTAILGGVGFGVAVGLAMAVLYAGVLRTAPWFASATAAIQNKVASFGIRTMWQYAGMGLFYAAGHSWLEEYYWRWFTFRECRSLWGERSAIIVSSLGFMAHHVLVLQTFFADSRAIVAVFSLSVAVGGAYWAWWYERSRSLVGPWLSHALVDAAIFAIGYDLVRSGW